MRVAAVIVAAGRGVRAGGGVAKQYRTLAGRSVIARSVAAFAGHPHVAETVTVVAPGDEALAAEALDGTGTRTVAGGATRGESVAAGLGALGAEVSHVLVHDAARPLVARGVVDRVLESLAEGGPGAAPALPVSDALWRGAHGHVRAAEPRAGLFRAETPQGFELAAIRAAHAGHDGTAADDVEVALAHGLEVAIVAGDADNIKITRPEDFARAERMLGGPGMDVRIGNGFDVHRFAPGDRVTLCGVEIPHDRGLEGHSDADAGMHALTDAIYGALAEGDIGTHFPPSEPEWAGAASSVFLSHAAGLVEARGYRVGNADVTIVCERPKIGPHAGAMRSALAGLLGAETERMSVKATTSEGLGFAGRGEGIAAMASVALVAR